MKKPIKNILTALCIAGIFIVPFMPVRGGQAEMLYYGNCVFLVAKTVF